MEYLRENFDLAEGSESLKRIADAAEKGMAPIHYHIPAGSVVRAVAGALMIDPEKSGPAEDTTENADDHDA